MKLIFVRHGAAIERTEKVSEVHRYLTPEGRAFLRKTARTMLKKGVEPGLVLTSPLVRAVQTADILAEALSYIGPVMVAEELSPGFDPASLRTLFKRFHQVDELVLVGHEPDLSDVVCSLLSLEGGFSFKKGTAVALKCDPTFNTPVSFKWLASGKKCLTSQDEAFTL
jgi:phosphohistidine phosphatase